MLRLSKGSLGRSHELSGLKVWSALAEMPKWQGLKCEHDNLLVVHHPVWNRSWVCVGEEMERAIRKEPAAKLTCERRCYVAETRDLAVSQDVLVRERQTARHTLLSNRPSGIFTMKELSS